MAGILAILKK
jgi:hypothetical protein